jgi:4-hydroxy-3-methylbut-2-enyl diphosphate reductase
MTLHVARYAGFCAGVAHAVNTVLEKARHTPIATLGPLTHNRTVTDDLAEKGVRVIENLTEARNETVVIRAHGVPFSTEEEMKAKNIPYIDCTCTCVKAIHRRAAKARDEGRTVIILGEAGHPEIMGILGYAGDDFLVALNAEEIKARLKPETLYTMVAQTTLDRPLFEEAADILRGISKDAVIFDTLCDATGKRYAEARSMAKQMDVMLILGDADSANTNRLYQIAKRHCPRSFLLGSIRELQLPIFRTGDRIGLTAGASTPPVITKEAIQFMSDITTLVPTTESLEPVQSEIVMAEPVPAPAQPGSKAQSFEEMLNESFRSLHTGDIVKGTVISVSPTEVMVNLGYKSDGIISRSEMTDDSAADITQLVKLGDEFDVYVLRVNDGDGNVQVSKKKLDNQIQYKILEQAHAEKSVVKGKVTETIKGGFIAMIENCRVFIPSSQISNRYVEDLKSFKGKELNFHILEFDRSKRRIVAGRKELAGIEQQQRRDELFASLEPGQRLEGTVSRIVEFGAFIDLGGVDGLIHISELAWRRVRKVTDVLQVGDAVTVTVIDINPEMNKISLSLKDINANPWNNIAERYPIGSIIEGKVVRLASFGAFINLEEGLDGLVHVSQIADRHIAKPDEVLTVGDVIKVKVTDIDEANHKLSLSKREADVDYGVTAAEEEYMEEEFLSEAVEDEPGENIEESF